MGTLHDDLGTL